MYTPIIKWMLWYSWLLTNQTVGNVGCFSMKQREKFGNRCFSMKQTTVHGGSLSKTSDEGFDFAWSSTKQTSEQKWYNHAWLSMKQSTDLNGFMSINWNKRYKFRWLSMKQLTERGRWRSMKQLNEIILEVHRWYKRLSMMEVYPKHQREKNLGWLFLKQIID